ncbi:MAG TPA: hypothetical protein DD733_10315 [Clostridiales bacterium]|nr:hypothetical protein [Clostridiales bacterium]
MTTLYLAIGLIILIAVNIILGSLTAIFGNSFDWKRFRTGIYKGGIVFLCLALVYLAGWLNQDIMAFEVSGQTVNLMQAVYFIIFAGYVYYGSNTITKFTKILTSKTATETDEPPSLT